jgi:hypothetical protein
MKVRSRVFRLTGIILAGFIGLGLFPAQSFATVINDCPGGVCSLQDLLNGSTITINDKRFDSWQLFNQDTSFGQFPDYSRIAINPIDDSLNPGLSFSANGQLSITKGVAGDFIYFDFGYRVQTVDNVPRIKDNSLQLGGYNFSGAGGSVGISQTVCEGGFFCPLSSSDLVSLTNVFADNAIPAVNFFDAATFLPHAELFVENEVSAFNNVDGESVALNGFEQRFSQISEPNSFALLSFGLVGLLLTQRRLNGLRGRKNGKSLKILF